jgi:preprotein translocase SecE subunit
VTWPDYDQLRNATIVVIVFVFIISSTILVMDFTIRTVIDWILRVTGGA